MPPWAVGSHSLALNLSIELAICWIPREVQQSWAVGNRELRRGKQRNMKPNILQGAGIEQLGYQAAGNMKI